MTLYRVKSYYTDDRFTFCEHLYAALDSASALAKFLRDYPAHRQCKQTVQEFDPKASPQAEEYYRACSNCGCVHYW